MDEATSARRIGAMDNALSLAGAGRAFFYYPAVRRAVFLFRFRFRRASTASTTHLITKVHHPAMNSLVHSLRVWPSGSSFRGL